MVGIYFALMEIIIIGQYIYYKYFYKNSNSRGNGENQEPNEYDRLIVKTEGGESNNPKDLNISSPQHTYETFSDIQKSPIKPPLDPVDATDGTPKVNIEEISTSSSKNPSDPTIINNNNNNNKDNESGSLSSLFISKGFKPSSFDNETIKVTTEPKSQSQPQPELKPELKSSQSNEKYETLDEISQKQQEAQTQAQTQEQINEVPIYNITTNINKDTHDNAFSASVSGSLSQVNMRSTKKESQEILVTNTEDEVEEEGEKSRESLYEDSSKEVSTLSLDTKDEGEDGEGDEEEEEGSHPNESLNRSESSLNKGKKKKKGKKNRKVKGLSSVIQTIALLSLFIIQVQARAFYWPEGYYSNSGKRRRSSSTLLDIYNGEVKLCDEGPHLSKAQKVFGSFMAWSCGILYFYCRIPQIIDNRRNRSVEGLSILLFICTILGNLFYGLSIMTRFPPIDDKFFFGTLPYLFGSVGTFIFDVIIVYQFRIYRNPSESAYQHLE